MNKSLDEPVIIFWVFEWINNETKSKKINLPRQQKFSKRKKKIIAIIFLRIVQFHRLFLVKILKKYENPNRQLLIVPLSLKSPSWLLLTKIPKLAFKKWSIFWPFQRSNERPAIKAKKKNTRKCSESRF